MTTFVWKPSIVHKQRATNIHMKNHPFIVVTNGPNCGSHPLEPKFIFKIFVTKEMVFFFLN
jgi:hypothetical protein